MPTPHLTSYRALRKLLHDVCRQQRAAEVVAVGARDHAAAVRTRFLTHTAAHLLLDWPAVQAPGVTDGPVRILFEHEGQTLAAVATPHGPIAWQTDDQPPCRAWAFRLPVRIGQHRRRRRFRAALPAEPPVAAQLVSVAAPERILAARLRNVSGGGFSGLIEGVMGGPLQVGELWRAAFELPRAGAFKFIVRVAHARQAASGQTLVFGCAFCGADDETTTAAQLQRIEAFVAQQAVAGTPAAKFKGSRGA